MRRKLIILVADDDLTELQLLRRSINRDGAAVGLHEVHDGEEAIHYLTGEGKFADRKTHPFPDLLLLDLKMPKVDGVQVVKWLSTRPDCRHLPVVMLSGSGLEKDVKAAFSHGVSTYFSKPTDFKTFQKLVRILIQYWGMSELPEMPMKC
jgi:CheY-like chemotaxis protein